MRDYGSKGAQRGWQGQLEKLARYLKKLVGLPLGVSKDT